MKKIIILEGKVLREFKNNNGDVDLTDYRWSLMPVPRAWEEYPVIDVIALHIPPPPSLPPLFRGVWVCARRELMRVRAYAIYRVELNRINRFRLGYNFSLQFSVFLLPLSKSSNYFLQDFFFFFWRCASQKTLSRAILHNFICDNWLISIDLTNLFFEACCYVDTKVSRFI